MKHVSRNGKEYEIGEIKEYRGTATYDMVVIMDWNNRVEIINYYFGDYNFEVTEEYIKEGEA